MAAPCEAGTRRYNLGFFRTPMLEARADIPLPGPTSGPKFEPAAIAAIDDASIGGRPDVGNRLSKIYTRTGDAGTTGLGDGSRIGKDAPRIAAMGDVDELNSVLGLLLCEDLPAAIREQLLRVQHDLFDLGGELCIPGFRSVTEDHVARLEQVLEGHNASLPPLENFILPGGSRAASLAHLARTVCRRAERGTVALGREEAVSDDVRRYLNRLSDLLFVLGRVLNRHAGGADVLWQQRKPE